MGRIKANNIQGGEWKKGGRGNSIDWDDGRRNDRVDGQDIGKKGCVSFCAKQKWRGRPTLKSRQSRKWITKQFLYEKNVPYFDPPIKNA